MSTTAHNRPSDKVNIGDDMCLSMLLQHEMENCNNYKTISPTFPSVRKCLNNLKRFQRLVKAARVA